MLYLAVEHQKIIMKSIIFRPFLVSLFALIISPLAASAKSTSLNAEITWVSTVGGVSYKSEATYHQILNTSSFNPAKVSDDGTLLMEPKGKVSLAEAVKLGDAKAKLIFGSGYTSLDGSWMLARASRKIMRYGSANKYSGGYYHLWYRSRMGVKTKAGSGVLHVIILLDGTVLPIIKR